jgi:hypothetical protein
MIRKAKPVENGRSNGSMNLVAAALALTLSITLAFSNHFHNSFHFDDDHTVQRNPAIRSLTNVPLFFRDASSFSVLPSNASYRPIVSTTLAVDYWMGGGLNPFWFHLSAFVWYLVQVLLMAVLFADMARRSRFTPSPGWFALFVSAWYGLHPVNAETVNYVIQRGDLLATLGVVAGLTIYVTWPGGRKWGLYLVPVALGSLAKPPALMFVGILFVYHLLFESAGMTESPFKPAAIRRSLRASLAGSRRMCWPRGLQSRHDAENLHCGRNLEHQLLDDAADRLTALLQIVFPSHGIERRYRQAARDDRCLTGFHDRCGVPHRVGLVIWRTAQTLRTRPIAFGLSWFLLASVPTSLIALAEVENDHRMYFHSLGSLLQWARRSRCSWKAAARFLLEAWPTGSACNIRCCSPRCLCVSARMLEMMSGIRKKVSGKTSQRRVHVMVAG